MLLIINFICSRDRIPSLEEQIRMIIKKNLSLVAMVPGKDDIVGLLIIDEKVKEKSDDSY